MENKKQNKMGIMPVNRLLVSMSVPIMISMLMQALYNIVDSIFVARLSEDAFTAISLASPIQMLMISVAVGTGVGINALLSKRLGQRKEKEANDVALNGILLGFLSFIAFALLGIFATNAFVGSFKANADIVSMSKSYIEICTIFSLGLFMQITNERIMQATGNTIFNMITQAAGAIINIILDPILIFGLLGFPKLGVAGAAIATVLAQTISMIIGFYLNIAKNKELPLKFKGFRPNLEIIRGIYKVGIPSIIMQSIVSVMLFGLNKILDNFSTTAVFVLGVYIKVQMFVFMPIFGLVSGMIPIIAFNYGAQNKKRMVDTIKLTTIFAIVIMGIGTVLFQLFPRQILAIFDSTDEILALGIPAFKTISISFIFAGISIVISSVFQAIGNGVLSMIISFIRQIVVILPAAYFLANFIGVNAVWASVPLSEVIALIISLLMLKNVYRDSITILPNSPPIDDGMEQISNEEPPV